MNKKELPVALQRSEITWGLRYLLFQLVFLGPILALIMKLLGLESGELQNAAYFLVNFGSVILIFRRYLLASAKHGIRHWVKLLLASVIGMTVYFLLFWTVTYLIRHLVPDFHNANDAAIAEDSRSNFLLTLVGTVFLVPLSEEALYRGLIFGGLHKKSRLLAYALSTLLFSFIHVMGYMGQVPTTQLLLAFMQYIPAGLTLAWSYEHSGSIFAPLFIHTAVNAIAIYYMR